VTPLRLCWPDQTELTYNGETVVTRYPDETFTGGPVVPEDSEHAALLGITPIEHRLVHEVGHHLLSRSLSGGEYGCPILWAAAHNVEMPGNADRLEFYITALSYFAVRGKMRQSVDAKALVQLLEVDVDLMQMARELRWCLEAARLGNRMVTFGEAA
jgi:hypothetical protein